MGIDINIIAFSWTCHPNRNEAYPHKIRQCRKSMPHKFRFHHNLSKAGLKVENTVQTTYTLCYAQTVAAAAVKRSVRRGGMEGKTLSCISPTTPDVILPL